MQTTSNRLSSESSPYLIQHAQQPVDWYPWCEEAFREAEKEDKPVFLSIGYSTCHWCHVMARESFENTEIAELLNRSFISIKVDREERPDLDSLYMKVCQAMTGGGGWPMSIFLTPDKKPFFAGTYFPPDNRGGIIGFRHLLETISQKWQQDRTALLRSASDIIKLLKKQQNERTSQQIRMDETLLNKAVWQFCQTYDKGYGGFGNAPKFPSPHNLLFLLRQYEITSDTQILSMVETTLKKMYEGGLFDHIGYGFSRYATDRAFQIPHFEKMLYDNAMLIMAYARTYDITKDSFFLQVAEQTAEYVLREMTHTDGGFYSAQDADSDGMEGGYYVFRPTEIIDILGKEQGEKFNRCYGITEAGNFEGRSIPHLTDRQEAGNLAHCLPKLREYRLARCRLALDDKILTAWNGLMLAAMAQLARLTGKECYLQAALRCEQFILEKLCENGRLYASYRNGSRSGFGYLDDYAFMGFAMLELFQTTQDTQYLERAKTLCKRTVSDFWDEDRGGFYLSGRDNETLILRTKETYDGAIPSGNSVMAHNLVRLAILDANTTPDSQWDVLARRQLEFLVGQAAPAPMGHAFYLLALSDWLTPPAHITVVLEENADCAQIMQRSPLNANVKVLRQPTAEYPLKDGKTTYYVCTDNACLPPENKL